MFTRRVYDHDAIMALISQDLALAEVARRIGCTASRVSQIARSRGHDGRAARENALLQRSIARADRKAVRRDASVPPEYRTAGLADDYRDLVHDFGPAEGARRCRRLLDESRSPLPHEAQP